MTTLTCQMKDDCHDPVTHADNKGFVYCSHHGIARRSYHPCRKLLVREIKSLEAGVPIWWDSSKTAKKRVRSSVPTADMLAKAD